MRDHENIKSKAKLKDLYERWQIELGDLFFKIYDNPSPLKYADAAQMRKCLKFSPCLRCTISWSDGDLDLAREKWGWIRDSGDRIPFAVGVRLFGNVPGTVDERFAAATVKELLASGAR